MNERTLNRILDVIIYSCFIFVLIWSILKGIGVINTPLFVQQLPVMTGVLGLLGFAYKIGRFVENVEQRLSQHDSRFGHIDKQLENFHEQFEHITQQFNHIDRDLEFLKQRV